MSYYDVLPSECPVYYGTKENAKKENLLDLWECNIEWQKRCSYEICMDLNNSYNAFEHTLDKKDAVRIAVDMYGEERVQTILATWVAYAPEYDVRFDSKSRDWAKNIKLPVDEIKKMAFYGVAHNGLKNIAIHIFIDNYTNKQNNKSKLKVEDDFDR